MARKSSTTTQLNYGIYSTDRYGNISRQVFDGTEPARYETMEQAQEALPRLQVAEDAISALWLPAGTDHPLVIEGRTW